MSNSALFSRGIDKAIEDSANQGTTFERTAYFPSLKSDESVTLRWVTDYNETYSVLVHGSVKTKPKPSSMDKEAKWPESMPAICRNDEAFKSAGMYDSCYICDNKLSSSWGKVSKPSVRVYGIAVLRKPVVGTQEMADAGKIPGVKVGRTVGYVTETREVERIVRDADGEPKKDKEGKMVTETVTTPAFVLVNKSVGNFWRNLRPFFNADGTICGRDYTITAMGEGTNVDFVFNPADSTPSFEPGTDSWKSLLDELDKTGEFFDIPSIFISQSSDEYIGHFFDPSYVEPTSDNKGSSSKSTSGSSSTSSDKPQSVLDLSEDNMTPEEKDILAKMRERLASS